MAGLTGDQRKRLEVALLSAYRHYHDLERMVSFGLNENLAAIADENSALSDVVFSLIEWAEAQGRIPDMLRASCTECYGNAALNSIAAELGVDCPKQAPAPTRLRSIAPWQWAVVVVPLLLVAVLWIALNGRGGPARGGLPALSPTTMPLARAPTGTPVPLATATLPLPTPPVAAGLCTDAATCLARGNELKQQAEAQPPASQKPLWEQAIEQYNRAVQFSPASAEALSDRGYAYDRIGRFQDAVADYNRVINDLRPNDGLAYYNRGSTYYRWGQATSDPTRFGQAIADMDAAISRPEDSSFAYHMYAYFFRGSAHRLRGETAPALADLTAAWQLCLPSFLRTEVANEFRALNTAPPDAVPATCMQ